MTWHFPDSEPPGETHQPASDEAGGAFLRLSVLEEMEADLVRNLVTLKERHAFTPNEVTMRQVTALEEKLADIRLLIDHARERSDRHSRRA
jgi:hypothetical protein